MFNRANARFPALSLITIVASAALSTAVVCPRTAFAVPITSTVVSLGGSVEPITYTDGDGTFTTGPIVLTLNTEERSTVTVDTDTGVIRSHTVMDVSFNNGKPGDLNETLFGVFTIDESGILGSDPILMTIDRGILAGAGRFEGTLAKGRNPVFRPIPPRLVWRFGFSPTPDVLLDLPPGFENGTDLPIVGVIEASLPIPSTAALLLVPIYWLRRIGPGRTRSRQPRP